MFAHLRGVEDGVMLNTLKPILAGAALLAGTALPASAADIYEPPVIDYEPPVIVEEAASFNGWYIRGDIDFHKSRMSGVEYITYGPPPGTGNFDFTELKSSYSLGAGVGYQVSNYLRTDLTADYWFRPDFEGGTSGWCGGTPCSSTDTSSFRALLLLANAYAEFGTYKRFTPYIGAGIGGAHIKWGDLRNQIPPNIDDRHRGASGWRFAWAVMAGASYCITRNLHADFGYRYSRISGGKMFEYVDSSGGGTGAGPGFHKDISTHEARAGLRYQFGGGNASCDEQEIVYNDPEPYTPPPVYK